MTAREVLDYYVSDWDPPASSSTIALALLVSQLIELHLQISSLDVDQMLDGAKVSARIRIEDAWTSASASS